MNKYQTVTEPLSTEVRVFKYLIYLFLILLSYKLSMSVALLFGFFPENQQSGLAIIIFAPLFLLALVPTFLIILSILFLIHYYLFKSDFFRSFASNHESLIFWIILGVIPYLSLPYLNLIVLESQQKGYTNRKEYTQNVQRSNEKRREAYREKLLNATREEALEAVKEDGSRLSMLSEAFKKDREIVYEAVKQNPYQGLISADCSFKRDREFMLMVVEIDAHTFCQADKELRKDKEFALVALNGRKDSRNVFSCMDRSLQNDREVILASIRKNPSTLRTVSRNFKKDREIVLEAVKREGFALSYADATLQKDRELVLVALKQSGYALEYVDATLKKDREIALTALRTNGGALRYATAEQKADREMVLTAVQNTQESYERPLRYADIAMLDDREIALASVKKNGLSLEQLSMRMKSDREVVLVAIKENKYAIDYASQQLQEELK